jgi:hypothetical protein
MATEWAGQMEGQGGGLGMCARANGPERDGENVG